MFSSLWRLLAAVVTAPFRERVRSEGARRLVALLDVPGKWEFEAVRAHADMWRVIFTGEDPPVRLELTFFDDSPFILVNSCKVPDLDRADGHWVRERFWELAGPHVRAQRAGYLAEAPLTEPRSPEDIAKTLAWVTQAGRPPAAGPDADIAAGRVGRFDTATELIADLERVVPADGVRGWLLYNPFRREYFFRVYESADKRQFTDYRLAAADVEVVLVGEYVSLHKDPEKGNRLDYSRRVLGKDSPKEDVS